MSRFNLGLCMLLFLACQKSKEQKEVALYNSYCASCHKAPDIADLPKKIWKEDILPEMGARLGIRENGYDPLHGLSFTEMEAILKTGTFPDRPVIRPEDWAILRNYILKLAPDSILNPTKKKMPSVITQFTENPVSLDSNGRSSITFLKFDADSNKIIAGELSGRLFELDFSGAGSRVTGTFRNTIVDYTQNEGNRYVTAIGSLRPSELTTGTVFFENSGTTSPIPEKFHRPVSTLVHDFNSDGKDELVVCEFGDLTGALSFLINKGSAQYERKTLLNQPGSIRAVAEDMDKDGKTDIVVLTAQGDEGVTIFYQKENLEFAAKKVIRFSPVYGSSWFELLDYNGDGNMDIVSVQGDNADKSNILKPYHGMRIHINNGEGEFEEVFFYPFHGATRVVTSDFDQDGDSDFALLSTFPDYQSGEGSFVYLRNDQPENFTFSPFSLDVPEDGRWFLMVSGDIDLDGDEDIVLSSFSESFTPAPPEFANRWKAKDHDVLLLKNNLNPRE